MCSMPKVSHSSHVEFRVSQTSVGFLRRLGDRLGGLLHGCLPLAKHVIGKALALLLQVRPASLPGGQPAFQLLWQPAGRGSYSQHTNCSSAAVQHNLAECQVVTAVRAAPLAAPTRQGYCSRDLVDCHRAGGAHSPCIASSRRCQCAVMELQEASPGLGLLGFGSRLWIFRLAACVPS